MINQIGDLAPIMTVATGLPANTAKESPLLKLRRWVIRPEDAHGGCHSRRRNEKPGYLDALHLPFWQLQVGREAVCRVSNSSIRKVCVPSCRVGLRVA